MTDEPEIIVTREMRQVSALELEQNLDSELEHSGRNGAPMMTRPKVSRAISLGFARFLGEAGKSVDEGQIGGRSCRFETMNFRDSSKPYLATHAQKWHT
jgi:hypothetical protein